MIRSVLKKGDPLLEERSAEVKGRDVGALVTDLWDTLTAIQKLYAFSRGSGLSAPQIGELSRVSVIEYEGRRLTMIDPQLSQHSADMMVVREGCLSFFDFRGHVKRFAEVEVRFLDEHRQLQTLAAAGDLSSLIQHELDHLNGILYDSRLAPGEQLFKMPDMPPIP